MSRKFKGHCKNYTGEPYRVRYEGPGETPSKEEIEKRLEDLKEILTHEGLSDDDIRRLRRSIAKKTRRLKRMSQVS